MSLSDRTKKIIDILQWLLIVASIGACFYIYYDKKSIKSKEMSIAKDDSYIMIYDSQHIQELEAKNKELYDSIKSLKNVESAVQIKYVYKYCTDTVYANADNIIKKDSIYEYEYDNDTVKYQMKINAEDLKWYRLNFELHNDFKIITANKNENVTTTIEHSPDVIIEDATAWRKKKSFWDHIYYGPSISVGYGIINKKPDMFIGVSAGYNFN